MLQAKLVKPKKIIFENVKIPSPKDNEVLVEVKYCGICGSDVHTYKGIHPFVKKYPIIQGHEFSGIISKVGREVKEIKVGQKITAEPSIVCGKCYNCKSSRYNICEKLKVMGFQAPGSMRNYFALPEDKIIPLPEDLCLEEGAMIEPLAVAVHSVKKADDIENKNVVVLGCGTIGILTAKVAKCFGAKKVMITDIDNFKLNYAKKFNIDYAVNTAKENLKNKVHKYFGKSGADVVFECVGVSDTMNCAIDTCVKGGKIIVAGVFSSSVKLNVGLIQDKELEVIGTLMYQKEDFLDAINLVSQKKVDTSLLITHKFPFEKLQDAYNLIESKRENFLKIMLEFV